MKRGLKPLALASELFVAFLLASIPARAQHMNEKDSPCGNVAVTVDLFNCLSKARDSSDAKLNSLYKTLRKRLDATDGERLTVAARRLGLVCDRAVAGSASLRHRPRHISPVLRR